MAEKCTSLLRIKRKALKAANFYGTGPWMCGEGGGSGRIRLSETLNQN